MDEDIKKGLKKIARQTEDVVTGSILRWKYKREGKKVPDEKDIASKSRNITEQANRIISKRGKNIWDEFKKAYRETSGKEGDKEEDKG